MTVIDKEKNIENFISQRSESEKINLIEEQKKIGINGVIKRTKLLIIV